MYVSYPLNLTEKSVPSTVAAAATQCFSRLSVQEVLYLFLCSMLPNQIHTNLCLLSVSIIEDH